MDHRFVQACEHNHARLSTVAGGDIVRLESGNVVTSGIDPFAAYNWAFEIRQTFDLPAALAAFRHAGRDYVHVRLGAAA